MRNNYSLIRSFSIKLTSVHFHSVQETLPARVLSIFHYSKCAVLLQSLQSRSIFASEKKKPFSSYCSDTHWNQRQSFHLPTLCWFSSSYDWNTQPCLNNLLISRRYDCSTCRGCLFCLLPARRLPGSTRPLCDLEEVRASKEDGEAPPDRPVFYLHRAVLRENISFSLVLLVFRRPSFFPGSLPILWPSSYTS